MNKVTECKCVSWRSIFFMFHSFLLISVPPFLLLHLMTSDTWNKKMLDSIKTPTPGQTHKIYTHFPNHSRQHWNPNPFLHVVSSNVFVDFQKPSSIDSLGYSDFHVLLLEHHRKSVAIHCDNCALDTHNVVASECKPCELPCCILDIFGPAKIESNKPVVTTEKINVLPFR